MDLTLFALRETGLPALKEFRLLILLFFTGNQTFEVGK